MIVVVVFGHTITPREIEYLQIFERVCRADFIENRRRLQATEIDVVIEKLHKECDDNLWLPFSSVGLV